MVKGTQIIAALLLMPSALAHICVWEPMQRGDFSIATPGSHDCYRKVGPCGGEDAGTTITKLNGGSSYEVHFQQNLNHYSTDDPGSLVVDYALNSDPAEEDFLSLDAEDITDYNAMNMITQTNFTRLITVPDTDADAAVLRVRYLSNNPDENDRGEIFYQCSDISITSSAKNPHKEVADNKKASTLTHPSVFTLDPVATEKQLNKDDDMSCCAPKSFTIDYYYTNPDGTGTIYYDADAALIRVDFDTKDESHSMYSNFTSGIEWYVDNSDGSCDEYGCDLWIDWCFGGDAYSETYIGSGPCGDPVNADCIAFQNGGWTFAATADECFPAAIAASVADGYGPRNVTYYNPVEGPIDPSIFETNCVAPSTEERRPSAPAHLSAVHATMHAHKASLGLN